MHPPCSKCGHEHFGRSCHEKVEQMECKCWVYTPRALSRQGMTNQGASGQYPLAALLAAP